MEGLPSKPSSPTLAMGPGGNHVLSLVGDAASCRDGDGEHPGPRVYGLLSRVRGLRVYSLGFRVPGFRVSLKGSIRVPIRDR